MRSDRAGAEHVTKGRPKPVADQARILPASRGGARQPVLRLASRPWYDEAKRLLLQTLLCVRGPVVLWNATSTLGFKQLTVHQWHCVSHVCDTAH